MLRVRSTPDEMKAYESAAKNSSKTISEWIRNTLNDAVQPNATFQVKAPH